MGFFMGVKCDYPSISSYAEAKKFHDDTKLNKHGLRWPSQTKIKHMFTCNGDGSIAFQLYSTECVTYHPDNSITIQGYSSQSTSEFIDRLTPPGIYHLSHSRDCHSPMLRLMPLIDHIDPPNDWHDEERRWTGPDWGSGAIVKCGNPVTLNYSVERNFWVPVGDVRPFDFPSINRKAARQVARSYRLAAFEKIARTYIIMQRIRRNPGEGKYAIATALREGRMVDACKAVPVGDTVTAYGRTWGGPGQPDPAFFSELRDWVYDHEGVIEYETLQMLTPQQYERWLKMSKRF